MSAKVASHLTDDSLISLARFIQQADREGNFYLQGMRLAQGAEILQGKSYPIVAIAKENLDEAMRFQDNRLLYPAHNQMARALIERMTLDQKTQLLGHYAQTPPPQIPQTVKELASEVKAQLQLQQKQKVQQQPRRPRDRDLEI